jgi:hypothetical protein
MAELGAFLIRLLRSNDLNMRPSWGYSFGVSNATVYEVAELVKGVGVKIKTCQNPPSIKDSWRVVYLLENTSINDSAWTVESPTDPTVSLIPHLL